MQNTNNIGFLKKCSFFLRGVGVFATLHHMGFLPKNMILVWVFLWSSKGFQDEGCFFH